MAFFLLKISPPPLLPHTKRSSQNAHPRINCSASFSASSSSPSPLTKVEPPPLRDSVQDKQAPAHDGHGSAQDMEKKRKNDFYLNVGIAVRTLREDIPALFYKDLNYDIYREDVTFMDPLNTFQGIDNYRIMFWALRFHGRVLFKEIGIEVFRVWQPSENLILIRWELQGIPRVPWEARGRFQGTSRYKLDRSGKIYEHKVDNLAFNFPRTVMKSRTLLELVGAACPTSPNLTFWEDPLEDSGSHPWVELYRAVKGSLEQEGQIIVGVDFEGLVSCS